MAQAAPARITCRVCDGWYASESELREHMQAAHRRFISAPIYLAPICSGVGDPQNAGTQPDNVKAESRNVKAEPRTPNDEWTNEESSPVSFQPGRAGR